MTVVQVEFAQYTTVSGYCTTKRIVAYNGDLKDAIAAFTEKYSYGDHKPMITLWRVLHDNVELL